MKLRLFVPILIAVPALAACGGGSGSSGAASAQAKAIASAEAQAKSQTSSAPAAEATTDAPSSDDSASASASVDDSSGSGSGSDCPDETVNGLKISNVLLTEGATCAQVSKVAASSQLAATLTGSSSDFSVDGFNCDVELGGLVNCELDGSLAEINFNADKQ